MIPTGHVVLGGLVAAALMIAVSTAVYYYYLMVQRRRRTSSSVAPSQNGRMDSSNKVSSARAGAASTTPLSGKQEQPLAAPPASGTTATTSSAATHCAWEQRRRRGIAAHSLHEKKDAGNEKPFGSSYYYAHNNTRAAGGYKDGLTMEDFTMNGPRLLSRGGKPVGSDVDSRDRDDDRRDDWEKDMSKTESMARNDKKRAPISLKRSVPISRYLWDDPGDAKKGIATLRIEELPGKHSTDPMILWKDVSITKINAELLGEEGLLVSIETATDVDYELRIPKLYGQVAEVEALAKPKRLLLRLKKKAGLLNKSNLQAWPHPQKKIS